MNNNVHHLGHGEIIGSKWKPGKNNGLLQDAMPRAKKTGISFYMGVLGRASFPLAKRF
jgi:hypothetical protein